MPVYLFVFVTSVILASIVHNNQVRLMQYYDFEIEYNPIKMTKMIIVFLPAMILLGMRSSVGDTSSYYEGFKVLSPVFSLDGLDNRAYGYAIIQRICKAYLFEHPNAWLIFLAGLSLIPIAINISKYSIDVRISVFVFFASTEFTYLINGARQFLAVCLCFFAFTSLLERKPLRYFIIVALACTIHITAVVMLPMYFVVRIKPWGWRMWIVIISLLVFCFYAERIFSAFDSSILSDSIYGHYSADVFALNGIKWQRTLVAFVPSILSLYKKNEISQENDYCIDCCINFSILSALCYLFATFLGGNLTARVAEYFNIFNIILYPFLLTKIYTKSEEQLVRIGFAVFYILFFIYQMYFAWEGLPYVSEVLGIFYE